MLENEQLERAIVPCPVKTCTIKFSSAWKCFSGSLPFHDTASLANVSCILEKLTLSRFRH